MFCKRTITQAPPPPFDPPLLEELIGRIERSLEQDLCGLDLLAQLVLEGVADYQRRALVDVLIMEGVGTACTGGGRSLLKAWVRQAKLKLEASASK